MPETTSPIVDGAVERLFSYGTLQLEPVQMATFGRRLNGTADGLPGFRLVQIEIQDAAVVATSGQTHHPMLVRVDGPPAAALVDGMVFAITSGELAQADAYEVAAYRRARVTLASGLAAWVYLDAREAAATHRDA